jgi:NADPH:quinone reductase-like Zn-dependent oxidoreductase
MLVMEAERFGGPQVVTTRQVPDPVAGPGQVVVRTSAMLLTPCRDAWYMPAARFLVHECPSHAPGAA